MTVTIDVVSRVRFNDTGLDVRTGQWVHVAATGEWIDWTIKADANSFHRDYLRPTEKHRGLPGVDWFRLCGAIGLTDATAFALGVDATRRIKGDGRLYLSRTTFGVCTGTIGARSR